jgi:hypothetical protein
MASVADEPNAAMRSSLAANSNSDSLTSPLLYRTLMTTMIRVGTVEVSQPLQTVCSWPLSSRQ